MMYIVWSPAMPTKVRKQIYLEQRQNRQLKRLAEARGVSEAQVVRDLIAAEAASGANGPLSPDRAAWEALVRFARQRARTGVTGKPYQWNRNEIYEERESRFGPLVNEAPATPAKTTHPKGRRSSTPAR
jgi:hypothetical protein